MPRGAFRAACLASAAICTHVLVPPATAQTQTLVDYDLPAQQLDDRLLAIARLSGREIIFASEAVQGLAVPPLRGRYKVEAAIDAALAGSELIAEDRAGALLIRKAAQREASDRSSLSGPITVTGTRIRGGRSASPLIVSTREELERSGVTDMAGFSRVLPQNFTGGQNPGVAGGGQGGQSNINNSATLNLRGLGPDATLTLINGHRIAYDALNQGIDIAAIPLGAVDRVEVIADGASALYGSDAVGGVVNILLRRDYDGLETTARVGGSTGGGNFQQQYSAVGGARWSSGGFMLALDHSRTSPIFADDRDYTRSLDPSLTLTLKNAQESAVVTGHQQITGGVSLELDGFAAQRRSRKQTPFLADADVFTNGLATRPKLKSYALAPTLRIDLPVGWQGSLGATRAVSRTTIETRRFFDGTLALHSELTYENRLSGIEATAEGPLFAAPGGDARLAIGGGLRNLVLDVNITDIIDGSPVVFRDFTESRHIQFAYGELSVPLIGPELDIALVERLQLSGAARYERYGGIDEVVTPKLGLVYLPHPDITFRGSWGKSFKVPTLNQVNQVLQGFLLPGFVFAPQPEPPLSPDATVLLLGGGNPDLRAERAETWSASLELRPRFLEGLRLEATYFDVDYRDRIASPISGLLSALSNPVYSDLIVFAPSVGQVNALVGAFPEGLVNQTGRPFDPSSVEAIIDTSLRNTAREHARGFDLAADYRLDLGTDERLLLTAAASYLENDQQLAPRQPVIQRAGIIFNPPHWRARFGATWQGRTRGLSAFVNYVGSVRDDRFPVVERVGPFVTLDVSASVRTGDEAGPLKGLELRLSALNLLDEEPDVIRNSQPEAPSYDSTNQSPIGRFIGLTLRKMW